MSVLTDQTDQILKSGKDLAEGVNKEILRLRSDRLDGILNGEILPYLGLHTSLIGACILLFQFRSWPSLFILFSSIVAGLSVAYFVSRLGAQRQAGILGACAVFATAAAASAPISEWQTGIIVVAAYALVAMLAIFRKIDPGELLFAPLYSAILMQVSSMRAYQIPLYLAVFVVGILALIQLGRIRASFGLLAGMLLILGSEVNGRTSGEGGLVVICIVSIFALLIYMIRAVETVNSDFRNFLSQGLAALTSLAIMAIFTQDPRPYWFWPIGLCVFFAWVHVLRGWDGLATAIAWTCIASVAAIWLCSGEFGIASWDTRGRLLVTLAIAEGLYVVGRVLRSRFVCDLARLLLLAGGVLCFVFASQVGAELATYLKTSGSIPFGHIRKILAWNSGAIGVALAFALLAALCVGYSYKSGSALRGISWWRGLIKPRHAVLVRAGFRVSVKWFATLPILGAGLKALQTGAGSLRYLKTGAEPLGLPDLAALASTILLGFSIVCLCDGILAGSPPPPQSENWAWVSHTIAWTGCALLVYLFGLGIGQSLFIFAGGGFALLPIVEYVATIRPIRDQQLGVIALTSGLALVLCGTFRRGLRPECWRKKQLETESQSPLAGLASPVAQSTSPDKRKLRPLARTMTLLVVGVSLVLAAVIYFGSRHSGPEPATPELIAKPSLSPSTPIAAISPSASLKPTTRVLIAQSVGSQSAPEAVVTPSPAKIAVAAAEEPAWTSFEKASKERPWQNSLGMKFVPVAGTEVLFSIWDTRVQDFRAFVESSGYDATVGMWSVGKDGWKRRGATWKEPGFKQGSTHPVVGVSWADAKAFCEWLTKRERGSGVLPKDVHYRLPTDQEWSVAVGLDSEPGNTPEEKSLKIKLYPWGKEWPPPSGAGNYYGVESRIGNEPKNLPVIEGYNDRYPRTSPVGSFSANNSGLYDMGGNVWQWCEDWYNSEHKFRVLRGASWNRGSRDHLLASRRGYYAADRRFDSIGFRCIVVREFAL